MVKLFSADLCFFDFYRLTHFETFFQRRLDLPLKDRLDELVVNFEPLYLGLYNLRSVRKVHFKPG